VSNKLHLKSVKLHLKETDGRRDASLRPSVVRSFVSLSLVPVRGVHPMGETMLHINLRGGG